MILLTTIVGRVLLILVMVGNLFLGLENFLKFLKIGSIMQILAGFTGMVTTLIHYGFTLLNTVGFSLQNRFSPTSMLIIRNPGFIGQRVNFTFGIIRNGVRFNACHYSTSRRSSQWVV